jgi:hypothetical protein
MAKTANKVNDDRTDEKKLTGLDFVSKSPQSVPFELFARSNYYALSGMHNISNEDFVNAVSKKWNQLGLESRNSWNNYEKGTNRFNDN